MKYLRYALPRALGIVAAAWLATLMSAGCGDSRSSAVDPDTPKDVTPASLSTGRDASGNILLAFFDENGDPMAVDKAILESQISLEPTASVSAIVTKASGSESLKFLWSRYFTSVKIVVGDLNPCTAFELCVGEEAISQACSELLEAGVVESCDPLDIAGCYDFPASKSSGDLLALDGEVGCYDDFVVAMAEDIPLELTLGDDLGERRNEIDELLAEMTALGMGGTELYMEVSTLDSRSDSLIARYEGLGGEVPAAVPEASGCVGDPDYEGCVAAPIAIIRGYLDAYEEEMNDLEFASNFKVTTISVYAGSSSPVAAWEPSAALVHTGSESVPYLAKPLAILGNVDGGDLPRVVFGGPAGDSKNNFLAIPVADGVLPEFDFDPGAMEIGNYAVLIGENVTPADAGDLDGDGFADILFRGGSLVSVVRGGSLAAGISNLDDSVALSVEMPGKFVVAAGADVNGTVLDSERYDDVVMGFRSTMSNGMVAVSFGSEELDGVQDVIIIGENENDWFGAAVDMGDVDGDGFADILVSAPMVDSGKVQDVGAVYIVRGKRSMPYMQKAGGAWSILLGDSEAMQLGSGLRFLGDLNRDGYGDFSVPLQKSAVYIFLGSPSLEGKSDASASASLVIGTSIESSLGGAIPLGDINGDGSADFLIRYLYTYEDVALCIFLGGSYLEDKIAEGEVDVTSADIILTGFGPNTSAPIARIRR